MVQSAFNKMQFGDSTLALMDFLIFVTDNYKNIKVFFVFLEQKVKIYIECASSARYSFVNTNYDFAPFRS